MEVLNSQEIAQALILLVEVFEEFNIPYYIGGSVASSVLGEPRATFDIDVVAAIQPGHVSLLIKLLESEYYIDAQMVRDAIRNRSSIDLEQQDPNEDVKKQLE